MLGHPEIMIRDAAVQYLNVLYDGIDWQLRKSFKPKISCVGDRFKIDYLIEAKEEESNSNTINLNSQTMNIYSKPSLKKQSSFSSLGGNLSNSGNVVSNYKK